MKRIAPIWMAIGSLSIVGLVPSVSAGVAPKCISDPVAGGKGEGARPEPEALIAPAVADLAGDEVVARLVYAEALASRCTELYPSEAGLAETLTEGIARMILNRVRADRASFGKGEHGVVLKLKQFRSTFGSCDTAKRKEFLCPDPAHPLWTASLESVKRARAAPDAALKGVYHYFFPRHFDESVSCRRYKGISPDWLDPKREVRMPRAPASLEKCAPFYRL